MTLKSRAIKGIVGFGSVGAIHYFLSFVAQLAFARLLTPEAFGIVALGAALMTLVGLVGRWGINEAVMQDVDQENVFSTIFWLRLAFSIGIVVLVVAASPLVSLFYDAIIVDTLLVFAVSKSLVAAANPFRGAMTREFKLTYLALGRFISLVVSVMVGIWIVVVGGLEI